MKSVAKTILTRKTFLLIAVSISFKVCLISGANVGYKNTGSRHKDLSNAVIEVTSETSDRSCKETETALVHLDQCVMLQYCCLVTFLGSFIPLTTQEKFAPECENKLIGILYDDVATPGLLGHPDNRCEIYTVEFSEPYLIVQKVQDIINRNLDFVFIPSHAPQFIQDHIKKFINITHNLEDTGDCLAYTNNGKTKPMSGSGDLRILVTRKGSLAQLQNAAVLAVSIFKEVKWHFSVIFFDNSYAPLADEFSARINSDYNLQTLYNTDHFSDEGYLYILLKELYAELSENHINFTIFGSHENARKILKQASLFDQSKENYRNTALRDHSSWLVVTSSSDIDNDLGTNNSLLDNVVLFNLLKEQTDAGVMLHNCTGSDINIYTLMWKTRTKCSPQCTLHRKFEIIGCAKRDGSINTFSAIFPNSNFGFNNRHLVVTTIWWPPFTERIISNGTTVGYFGYCMDLLQELGKALNFTYTVMEAGDGEFGRRRDNGSWSGMIGQLERREVDLMVATTSIRSDREMVMDFTIPFYYDSSAILMKKPDPNEKKVFILAKPLRWEVMACTGVVLVVCALFLCLMETMSPYYKVHGKGGKQDFQHSFWYMFGALLTQGGESVPKSPSGRTLISAFWLFAIVLVATYSGNLIAFLTVPLDKPPFNSLEEMIAQNEYKWGTIGGTFFVTWFNTSTVETLQAVWSGIKQFNKTDPEVLSRDPNVHISKMYREKYVYIGDKVYMDLRKSNQCDLITAEEEIPNNYYAVGLPNRSLYTKTFSDQIISLQEGGILHTFKEKHWPKSVFCFAPSGLQSHRISLIDLQSAFYLIGIGLTLGILVLLIEFIFHWCAKKCSVNENNENCVHLKTVATDGENTQKYSEDINVMMCGYLSNTENMYST